jgi:Family of unknown function (DUF5329)
MKVFGKKQFLFFLLLWAALVGGAAAATEAQKIEHLIQSVEQMKNAKFVRNGVEYDAKAAGEHLRMKLRAAGKNVKTADDFIRLCAAKSSVSGKPYQIKFGDGKVVTSEAFLRRKLKELGSSKK